MPRQLVLITGPIASGKTAVAREVAKAARRRSLTAAAIDMDTLVQMLIGDDWLSVTLDDWLIAREVAAHIA
jgi:tRNA uridine 5-carbamoylmethylation protein Kti12